jgi:hypothetical protein
MHGLTNSVAGRSRVVLEDVLLLPEPPKPSTTGPPDPPEHKAAAPDRGDDHRVRLRRRDGARGVAVMAQSKGLLGDAVGADSMVHRD